MAGEHSTLSPSSAKRWLNCPGSVGLCARAPEEEPSEYAAEGTLGHTVCEMLLKGETPVLGEKHKVEGFDLKITQEMIDGAHDYLDYIEGVRAGFAARKKPAPVTEKMESRVYAKSMDPDQGKVWGRSDFFIYRKGDRLVVIDYKFGRRSVGAEENDQGCTYAIGVMDTEAGWVFNEVEIAIVQPRDMTGAPTVKTWVTTPAWLKAWRDTAVEKIRATRMDNPPVVPGSWCDETYCRARAFCPVLRKAAGDVAQSDFAIAPVAASAKQLPEIQLLTTKEQEAALLWRDNVSGWFKALEAALQAKAEGGERLEHWKLVEGRANRQWLSEEEVVKTFGPSLGDDLYKRTILSPSQVEQKLKLKKQDTAALTFKPEGRRTLAPLDDKREAVGATVREDFAPVCKMCEVGFCRKHPRAKEPVWPI